MAEGKPKLYYFDLFGRMESTRMTLWKAGVEYEDNRVTGDAWKELKESGKLDFGQTPMVELADGTRLTQSNAIVNYFGAKHGLKPTDPMLCFKGERAVEHVWSDFVQKHVMKVYYLPDDAKAAALEEMVAGPFKDFLNSLSSKCLGDTKFLTGDEVTIHDF